jgi:hypothetical protein
VKVCVLMMQKNEFELFPVWVRYHGEMFGYENLYVFDNGSNVAMDRLLRDAEVLGVNVDRSRVTFDDFQNKGLILSKLIRKIDQENPAEIYFPLDCDEFIGVEDDKGRVSIAPVDVLDELKGLSGNTDLLMIRRGYDNHPVYPGVFAPKTRRKCFFARDTCVKVSAGYHSAVTKNNSGERKTRIVYLHMHYKPLSKLRSHSMQKLVGRVSSFMVPALLDHRDKNLRGYHLVDQLFLRNQDGYLAYYEERFPKAKQVEIPEFIGRLLALGYIESAAAGSDQAAEEFLLMDIRVRDPAQPGLSLAPDSLYSAERGYGWLSRKGLKYSNRVDREIKGYEAVVLGTEAATFRMQLPPGIYRVEVLVGDPKGVARSTVVRVSTGKQFPELESAGRQLVVLAFDLELENQPFVDLGFSTTRIAWVICAIRVLHTEMRRPDAHKVERMRVDRWEVPPTNPTTLGRVLNDWLAVLNASTAKPITATGMRADAYLDLMESGVDYFRKHQDNTGSIVDLHRGAEFQYATPCYAYAAALIARYRGRRDLVGSATRAFTKAASDLAARTAADGHEDFYAMPLAHAYRILEGLETPAALADMAAPLAQFDPYAVYRKPPGGRGGSGSNWNCVALAGHFLLYKFGARSSALDLQYVEDSLLAQGSFFRNQHGLYMEGPSAYDIFPRAWLADMLSWGYDGEGAQVLQSALERSACASLFLQSPTGEWVCGGRSGQHVWVDSMQCVVFEAAARNAVKNGQRRLAGVYRRAARRALGAIRSWRRASGELTVVKNHFDPTVAHGFEVYSSHSQYNLLALTALGFAYEHALAAGDDLIEELTPAEGSTALFRLDPPMSLIGASAGGTQIVVHTEPKPGQNPAGLLRVHFLGCPSHSPIPDNLVALPQYRLPQGNNLNVALGLCWYNDNGRQNNAMRRSIADVTTGRLDVAFRERPPLSGDTLKFDLTWRFEDEAPCAIVESFTVSAGRVTIEYGWQTPAIGMAIRLPILVFDGRESGEVAVDGASIKVIFGGVCIRYSLEGTASPDIAVRAVATRNGVVEIYEAVVVSPKPKLLIERL